MNDVYSANESIDNKSKIIFSDEHEEEEVQEFIEESIFAYKCTLNQSLMMSLAWVLPRERELFMLFPEIITVDYIADINKEARPVLAIAGKLYLGKMISILRAFLPNGRNWVFRWIFSVGVPHLFDRIIISKVRLIIYDDDAQECTSIDITINLLFPQVKRFRCGWHLVHRNFDKSSLSKS